MKIDPREVAARAIELAHQRNLTEREASIDAVGKPDLIRDMKRGRMPGGDRLDALAVTLGTTVDFLLGKAASSLPADAGPADIDLERLPLDVPMVGTALGANLEVEEDGHVVEIEQTIIEMTEVRYHVRRYPGIAGDSDAYSLTVVGDSMSPRYDDGDPIWVSTRRQPGIGDYVVAQLVSEENGEVISAIVKRLVGRGGTYYEFEQFTPHMRFRIARDRVLRMHYVLNSKDLAGH